MVGLAEKRGSAMILDGWYRDLARINRQISEARGLIKRQNALISTLKEGPSDPESAIALLGILNDTLAAMISHRTNVLGFVRTFPLLTAGCTETEGQPERWAPAGLVAGTATRTMEDAAA